MKTLNNTQHVLKDAQRVFLDNFLRLKGNIVSIVMICGLILMPCLYVWFSLLAFWNPEENTGNLSVAVANEDAGYQSDLIPVRLTAGAQVVDELRANSDFNWQFVTKENAIDGVKSGRYYAAIIIPENFSANMASVLSSHEQHPEIEYYVNEKENPIAPHLTQIGATTIQADIDKTFTDTVTSIALQTNVNLGNYLSGQGVEAYGNTLVARLGSAIDELKSDAQQVRAFSSLLQQTQALVETSSGVMHGVGDVATRVSPIIQDTEAAVNDTVTGTDAMINLASSALSGAKQTLVQMKQASDTAAADMKTAPGALQSDINSMNTLLVDTKTMYQQALAEVQKIDPSSPLVGDISRVIQDLTDLQGSLNQVSNDLVEGVASSQEAKQKIDAAIDKAISDIDQVEQGYGTTLRTAADNLKSNLTTMGTDADTLTSDLAHITALIGDSSQPLQQSLVEIRGSLDATAALLEDSATSLTTSRGELSRALDSGDLDEVRRIIGNDPQRLADILTEPTGINRHEVYAVANFGSAMSPFYTSLGLFIASIFLVVVLKTALTPRRREELGNPSPTAEYLGMFGFFFVIALAQALLMCTGNLFFLQIQCKSIVLYYLTGITCAFVFLNIIFALTMAFDNIGKALAVILLVMQVAGAGGELPIQLSAPIFQAIYPWLPFTHSMNLFQGAVAGVYGNQFVVSFLCLLAFVVPALILGIILRRPLMRANDWINAQLHKTGII